MENDNSNQRHLSRLDSRGSNDAETSLVLAAQYQLASLTLPVIGTEDPGEVGIDDYIRKRFRYPTVSLKVNDRAHDREDTINRTFMALRRSKNMSATPDLTLGRMTPLHQVTMFAASRDDVLTTIKHAGREMDVPTLLFCPAIIYLDLDDVSHNMACRINHTHLREEFSFAAGRVDDRKSRYRMDNHNSTKVLLSTLQFPLPMLGYSSIQALGIQGTVTLQKMLVFHEAIVSYLMGKDLHNRGEHPVLSVDFVGGSISNRSSPTDEALSRGSNDSGNSGTSPVGIRVNQGMVVNHSPAHVTRTGDPVMRGEGSSDQAPLHTMPRSPISARAVSPDKARSSSMASSKLRKRGRSTTGRGGTVGIEADSGYPSLSAMSPGLDNDLRSQHEASPTNREEALMKELSRIRMEMQSLTEGRVVNSFSGNRDNSGMWEGANTRGEDTGFGRMMRPAHSRSVSLQPGNHPVTGGYATASEMVGVRVAPMYHPEASLNIPPSPNLDTQRLLVDRRGFSQSARPDIRDESQYGGTGSLVDRHGIQEQPKEEGVVKRMLSAAARRMKSNSRSGSVIAKGSGRGVSRESHTARPASAAFSTTSRSPGNTPADEAVQKMGSMF
jgi:hypothetical protein